MVMVPPTVGAMRTTCHAFHDRRKSDMTVPCVRTIALRALFGRTASQELHWSDSLGDVASGGYGMLEQCIAPIFR